MLFLKSINTKCVSKYLSDLFSIQLALRYSRFLFRLRFPISIIQPSHQVGYTDISHNYYNPVCFLLCRWAYHRYIITGSRGGPVDLSFFICLTVFSISLCVIDCIISFSVSFSWFCLYYSSRLLVLWRTPYIYWFPNAFCSTLPVLLLIFPSEYFCCTLHSTSSLLCLSFALNRFWYRCFFSFIISSMTSDHYFGFMFLKLSFISSMPCLANVFCLVSSQLTQIFITFLFLTLLDDYIDWMYPQFLQIHHFRRRS